MTDDSLALQFGAIRTVHLVGNSYRQPSFGINGAVRKFENDFNFFFY